MIIAATTQLTKQSQQINRAFAHLDFEKIVQNLVSRALSIILTIVVFMIILWIGKFIINYAFSHTKRIKMLGDHRIATFHTLTLNIFRYTCLFFMFYALLSLIGVPVGTLIASAGIFSIALGLGAQGFVSDMVNGFFILMEKQLDVGDVVVIGTIKGTVSGIGLRTTRVVSSDGTLNYIPNRNITTVSNLSRMTWHTNVDLPISTTAPLERIKAVIETTNQQLIDQQVLTEENQPKIIGPVTVPAVNTKEASLVYRVSLTTTYNKQAQLTSDCLAAYITALNQAQVPLK